MKRVDDSCAIPHRQLVKFLTEAVAELKECGYDPDLFVILLEWVIANPTDLLRSPPAKVLGL